MTAESNISNVYAAIAIKESKPLPWFMMDIWLDLIYTCLVINILFNCWAFCNVYIAIIMHNAYLPIIYYHGRRKKYLRSKAYQINKLKRACRISLFIYMLFFHLTRFRPPPLACKFISFWSPIERLRGNVDVVLVQFNPKTSRPNELSLTYKWTTVQVLCC